MRCYKNIIVIICFFVFACVKVAWAQVVSGTTYNTPNTSYPYNMPAGWSGDEVTQDYVKILLGGYIQTPNFCQNGFSKIKLRARTYGGVDASYNKITISWYDAISSIETELGEITPTSKSNNNYEINVTNNPTANTEGYIKIQCKGASSTQGAGVSQVTITYTEGTCSSAPTHTLTTSVSPAGYGTVSPSSATVGEGSTATITATQNSGYAFDHWTVSGAGSSLSSTTTNPTTFTMGTANATVTAYFTALPAYRVTFNAGTGTCATPYLDEASGGAGVVLPSATAPSGCDPEYSFYGWSTSMVSETSTPPSIVGTTGDIYHPTSNTTLYAVYIAGGYEKVTSNLTDWSGTYLIVYETDNKAFDGSLTVFEANNNNISVTITSNTIVSNATTDASSFVIARAAGDNYTIKSSSGYYIGRTTNSNGLNANTGTAHTNTISYSAGNVTITSSAGPTLKYNNQSGTERFRYYISGQQAIQLYRKNGASSYNSNPSCSCPAPSAFAASSITYTSASLSWTPVGTESNWQIVLSQGTPLGNPATGTIHNVTSASYNATALIPGSTYYAYVRAKCAEDDFSGWRMVQFETPCLSQILTLNNASVTLAPTDYFNLEFEGNASTGAITWTTSNAAVATVASDGRVTAVAEGHCVVTGVLAQQSPYCEATLSCNIHVASDDCARVGWGNKKDGGVYYQNETYRYSYTQQLYSANEIIMAGGTAGKIESIKVNHGAANLRFNSTVYIGMTDAEDLSDDWVSTGLTQVYTGTINFSAGWVEINLDTPFDWDGESNIVVAFNNYLVSGSDYYCISHDIGNTANYTYKKRYYYHNSMSLNSDNVPDGVSSTSSTNRVNMKFCITPCENPVDAYFTEVDKQISLSATFNAAALLTINPDSGHGAVTYSSSNPSVATVDEITGVVTPVAEGSVVITARVAATATHCSTSAKITLNICNCSVDYEQYKLGTGESNAFGTCSPVYALSKYGYRQIIYTKDELVKGTIESIFFNYSSSTAMTAKTDNVVIYMGNTTKSEFSNNTDWIPLDNLSQVYSGSFNCSQGWNKFDLNVPFEYLGGCYNLVVAIDDNSGADESSTRPFYTTDDAKYVQLYYTNYSSDVSPSAPSSGTKTKTYPDAKFCIRQSSVVYSHTLTYDITTNCVGSGSPTVTPTSVPSETTGYTMVTSIIPSCSAYAGFKEWNTAADGSGMAYHAGDRINVACSDVTLYAIYNNEVQGEASCANAVAFCSSSNEVSFHVEAGSGQTYGNFCAYFGTPATWWYMQISEPGDINMTIASTAGDVDMACWGPFDNKTCDLSDLSDNGSDVWYAYSGESRANLHYSNSSIVPTAMQSSPICSTYTLARPCGNLVDFGGTTSDEEYLQIIDAEVGEYYMVLVANYANTAGEITFTQTSGSGRASCDIVSNCNITSISANTTCTGSNSYTVSGEISFRDAPVDPGSRLTIRYSDAVYQTFEPPFASPIAYTLDGLVPNGSLCTLTASFTSQTINCEKTSSYTAPSKSFCEEIILPITLVRLRGECNGKRALISWTTASERNNDYFVLERSDDAVNFVEVGRVAGAGNSIEMLSYNYADYSIRTGENYYRLTQVDYDGTRTTSEIIEVHCSGNVPLGDPDVYVYPNPFGDELTVHLVNFGDVAAHIQVYDMLGRMLFERTADDTEVVLQLGALPDAAYTVRVSTADFVVNKKVVKNN